ncbi:MAG: hypothetical protein KBF88_03945 [Polyangiaceae bacterium]|nr:hypothetical protein [Polyangiaceae bacterium]
MKRTFAPLIALSFLVAATSYGCSSSTDETPTGDAGADADSGKSDATTTTDAAKTDSGTTPTTCKPADVSKFVGGSYKGAKVAKACDAAQFVSMEKSWNGDTAEDEKWAGTETVPSDCYKCAIGALTDATWAPIFEDGTLNLAGCIERKEGTAAGKACASALRDYQDCLSQACDTTCPIPEDSDDPGFEAAVAANDACVEAAACPKAVTDAFDSKCAFLDEPAGAAVSDLCYGPDQETFEQENTRWVNIVRLFCAK